MVELLHIVLSVSDNGGGSRQGDYHPSTIGGTRTFYLGHNCAPSAFQEPSFWVIVVSMISYTPTFKEERVAR
jgi:hypothetical protein